MTIEPEHRAMFEQMGEPRVRLIVETTGFTDAPLRASAIQWLAEFKSLERERDEASQDSLTRTALSAERAAWIGAKAAIIAVVGTIVGTIIIILTWLGFSRVTSHRRAVRRGSSLQLKGVDVSAPNVPDRVFRRPEGASEGRVRHRPLARDFNVGSCDLRTTIWQKIEISR
jgi:hypothetical protein